MSQIPSGVRKDQPGLRYQYLHHTVLLNAELLRSAWMAQSVQCPNLEFLLRS